MVKNQGDSSFGGGEVETEVVKGMLLPYDTEFPLQEEGLSSHCKLEEWWVEAGPKLLDETIEGVSEAVSQTAIESANKPSGELESAAK